MRLRESLRQSRHSGAQTGSPSSPGTEWPELRWSRQAWAGHIVRLVSERKMGGKRVGWALTARQRTKEEREGGTKGSRVVWPQAGRGA